MRAPLRWALVAVATLALSVAGCSTTVPSSPAGSSGLPSGPPGPPPSVPAPPGDLPPLPDASGLSGPELPGGPTLDPLLDDHADPSLEQLLPTTVAGTQLSWRSLSAADFIPPSAADDFAAFVGQLGGDVTRVTLATAFDPTGTISGSINALRVPGADPSALLAEYVALETRTAPTPPTLAERDIGGRVVETLTIGTAPDSVTRYIFGEGDVVFVVDAIDEQTAIAFIEAVP